MQLYKPAQHSDVLLLLALHLSTNRSTWARQTWPFGLAMPLARLSPLRLLLPVGTSAWPNHTASEWTKPIDIDSCGNHAD